MTPKAIVQQAIELLKIHQIRRENAVIHQQLQTCRDEVSDLRDAHNELRLSCNSNHGDTRILQDSASQTTQRLDQVDRKLEFVTRDKALLYMELQSLQALQDESSKDFEGRCAQHVDSIRNIELNIKESRDASELKNRRWTEEVAQVRKQLVEVVERTRIDFRNDQLNIKQGIVTTLRSEGRNDDIISCVNDSIEGNGFHRTDMPVQLLAGMEPTSTTEDLNSDLLLTLQPRNKLRESTVPDDVDLDDAANDISYAGHGRALATHPDSFMMLPYQKPDRIQCINDVVPLRQNLQETVTEYLSRGQDFLAHLTQDSESTTIRRWVEGLTDAELRDKFVNRLTSTSWSRRNLMDVACIYGIRESEALAPKSVASTALLVSVAQGDLPTILVPATDIDSNNSNQNPEVIANSPLLPLRPEPRRSQRIAARSLQEIPTQGTQFMETESQARRLDTRIAEAAKKRESRTKMTRSNQSAVNLQSSPSVQGQEQEKEPEIHQPRAVRPKKRKRIEDRMKSNALDRGNQDSGLYTHRRASKKPAKRHAKEVVARVSEIQAEDNLDTVGPIRVPRTPSRRTTRNIFATASPKHPFWLPSSPLHGKKPRDQIKRLDLKQSEAVSSIPSPYNPKPRLVSHEHHPIARNADLLSDSDVFLPRPERRKLQMREDVVVSKPRAPVRLARKKRRLPLPPPPEIPILSTSTEEHRRFDKW